MRRKLIIVFMVSLFMLSFLSTPMSRDNVEITITNEGEPVPEKDTALSAVSNITLYNVTYANTTYGSNTTVIWETDAMDNSDNTNASFLETQYASTAGFIFGDITTDSASNWAVNNRFDNLGVSTSQYYVGASSIEFQSAANAGDGYFELNNNTVRAMNADVSTYDSQNFSIKSTSTTMTLEYAEMVNTAGKYYLLDFSSLVIGTSWRIVGGSRAQATSVGGMTAADPVNYIHWHFGNLDNNEWIYFDCLKIYSAATTKRLSTSLNFTSLADFDHYSLNISASSNVTAEYMQLSDGFDEDEVYNVEGGGAWENFTILLNTTKIVADGYLKVFINDTALDDDYNSTLDIDFFQITAWNDTNSYPVINAAVCTNPDDTDNLYAGYKNYTFTLNISDADGFADIDYARIAFESPDEQYYWKVGFQEDTETFVEETWPGNVTLQTSLCSNVSSGNYLNLTFSIAIEIVHGTVRDFRLGTYVNDTAGGEDHVHWALNYDTEVDVSITSAAISDDRGNPSSTLYITGTAIYFGSSNLPLEDTYYDAWAINIDDGLVNTSDATLVAGVFNITVASDTAVGLETWYIGAKAQGANQNGACYCAIPYPLTYITDYVVVSLSTGSVFEAGNGAPITIEITATYAYDSATVASYSTIFSEDGSAISGSYTNADPFYKPIRYDESSIFTIDSFTDNTYGITTFTSNSIDLDWNSGGPAGSSPSPTDDPGDITDTALAGIITVSWLLGGAFLVGAAYIGIYGFGEYKGIPILQSAIGGIGGWFRGGVKGVARSSRAGAAARSSGIKLKSIPGKTGWKFGGWKLGGWKLKSKSSLPRGNVKGSRPKSRRKKK